MADLQIPIKNKLCSDFTNLYRPILDGARPGSNVSHPDGTIVHPAKENNQSAILMITFGIAGIVMAVVIVSIAFYYNIFY